VGKGIAVLWEGDVGMVDVCSGLGRVGAEILWTGEDGVEPIEATDRLGETTAVDRTGDTAAGREGETAVERTGEREATGDDVPGANEVVITGEGRSMPPRTRAPSEYKADSCCACEDAGYAKSPVGYRCVVVSATTPLVTPASITGELDDNSIFELVEGVGAGTGELGASPDERVRTSASRT
jgi:hypothetical protein